MPIVLTLKRELGKAKAPLIPLYVDSGAFLENFGALELWNCGATRLDSPVLNFVHTHRICRAWLFSLVFHRCVGLAQIARTTMRSPELKSVASGSKTWPND